MLKLINIVCLLVAINLQGSFAVEKLKLSSGYEIPVVGLGTSTIKLDNMEEAILSALNNGYRHIDTAFSYKNEAAIGKAVKKWLDMGNKREDLFITSKLPSQAHRPESIEKYLIQSLKDLDMDYVDMYLIHTPWASKEGANLDAVTENGNEVLDDVDHIAMWKVMEKQVKAGRAKSIGLSNFNKSQIARVYDNAEIKPSNLQVESHAYLHQKDLRKFCKERNIVVTAYAPLGSHGTRYYTHGGTKKELPSLLTVPLVKDELAQKYKRTPAQILLRHTVQDGLAVIPKSSNPARQKENIEIFDFKLDDEDMKKLDELDKGKYGRVFDFLAWYKDLDKHPQYPFVSEVQSA
ncbi:alcohol dehydrogenase [NADP(+)] B-like [Trichogramma pretiosum]|uniref:alcohol dehydrogenase [NADP(+)] B-like n=1 Tax=Trichogramma pretiosum TaxID=7493 RepID=UPI0006C9B1CB|nr:alcohol dehydrogenase [NADP(+)] B-like [Trichogramma pretiosum]